MRTEKILLNRVKRLNSIRAGSIFPKEFERGIVYGLLYALNKEPILTTRKEVIDFIDDLDLKYRKGS